MSRNTNHTLISIINSPQSYYDRCCLLAKIGDENLQHIILTNGVIEQDDLRFCMVKKPANRLQANKFWSWCYQQIKELVAAQPETKFILHEHNLGIVSFFVKYFIRKEIPTICSLYSGEFAFMKQRGWKIDTNGQEFVTSAQRWKIIRARFRPLTYRFFSMLGTDIIIGNSSEAAHELASIFTRKKRYVMNTCILPERYAQPQTIPANLAANKKHIKLLYAGNIYPAKGIGTLLKAFALLCDKYPDEYSLTMIGKIRVGHERWFAKLLKGYNLEGKVNLIPKMPQEALIAYYQHVDLLIFSSFFEGSPRVLKEAIAAGTLVLCSDIPGTRVVDPEQEICFFFEPGNAQELLQKIETICRALPDYAIRKKKGQQHIQAFSVENLAHERLIFYHQILQENARPATALSD